LLSGFLFIACRNEDILHLINKPPVANAGESQTLILPVDNIVLNGSGTDTDGYIISYAWSQVSGPAASTMVNANTAKVEVKNMVRGVYEFELIVTDNKMLTAKDRTVIYLMDSLDDGCPGCWDY